MTLLPKTLPPPPAGATIAIPSANDFSTVHLSGDLKGRSIRGGAVTLSSQALKFVLQTGSMVALARLLTPSDYGLVGMAAVVTGFIAIFRDLGLSQATIQRQEISQDQVSFLFWVNVAVSLLLAALTAGLGPAVAWFFGEPRLAAVMYVLSATFLFGGASAQHLALLRRQMRFSVIAAIEVVSIAVGIAAGIGSALAGAGYWSLVVLTVATSVTSSLMTWQMSRWRPSLPRRTADVREMLAFGGNLTGFQVVNYFTRNADNFLIGWYWGAAPLGLYAKAYQLLALPLQQLVAPISSVVVPALSRLQADPVRYRRYYRRALLPLMAAVFPLVVFFALEARNLVLVVLGEKWLAAANVFLLLSPAALIGASYVATGWVYVSLGRADRQLRWGLFASCVTVLGFLVTFRWGIEAVAASFSIVTVLLRYPSVVYCFRGTPMRVSDLTQVVWRPAAGSAAAALAVIASRAAGLPDGRLVELIGGGLIFVSAYAAAWLLLPGGRAAAAEFMADASHLRPLRGRGTPGNGPEE